MLAFTTTTVDEVATVTVEATPLHSRPLTIEEWELVSKNERLVSWALSRYSHRLPTELGSDLHIALQEALEAACRGYDNSKATLAYLFNRYAGQKVRDLISHSTTVRKALEVKATASTYYTEDELNRETETSYNFPKKVYRAAQFAARQLSLSEDRMIALLRLFCGEFTMREVANDWGVSKSRVGQISDSFKLAIQRQFKPDAVRELMAN